MYTKKKIISIVMSLLVGVSMFAETRQLTKNSYFVHNKHVQAHYDVGGDVYDELNIAISTFGNPYAVIEDNKDLNPEVAAITKKHGLSRTIIQIDSDVYNRVYILNTYDEETDTFQFYEWFFRALR